MAAEKRLERQHEATPRRQQEAILWDAQRVADALSIGQRTLWRWISASLFPKPDISMGGKVRRWKRETVEAWIDQQANGGNNE